jgi:hypothetical protein
MAKLSAVIKPIFLLLCLAWLASACNLAPKPEPTLETVPFLAPEVLATPAALSPAAGICGGFDGELVTITINPDMPNPRCAKIQPLQKLVVVNQRGETIQVRIGPFEETILPGGQQLFDLPFGEYLAPGVHGMIVSPCCGAELLLGMP